MYTYVFYSGALISALRGHRRWYVGEGQMGTIRICFRACRVIWRRRLNIWARGQFPYYLPDFFLARKRARASAMRSFDEPFVEAGDFAGEALSLADSGDWAADLATTSGG